MTNETQMTPQQHADHIAGMVREAIREARSDIQRVDDPKEQALFETAREVLEGVTKALDDYSHQSEPIWQ